MMEKVEGCTVNFITVKLAESGCCSFRLVVQSAKLFIHFLMFKKNSVQSGFGHDVKNCCLYLVGVIPRSPATYRSALCEIFNA